MKKMIALLLVLGFMLSCSACDESDTHMVSTSSNIKETMTEETISKITEVETNNITTQAISKKSQSSKPIQEIYAPYILPDGYYYESRELGERKISFLWIHQDKSCITFSQIPIFDTPMIGEEWKTETHENFSIFYLENETTCIYRFQNEKYAFELTVSNTITQEEIYLMIDSVAVKHIIDYSKIDGYNESYHYYACISCADCHEKRVKYHRGKSHYIENKFVITCEICGYTD